MPRAHHITHHGYIDNADDANLPSHEGIDQTYVPWNVVAKRIVYYIGGVLLAILALRFVFELFGASRSSDFVDFIYNVSNVFVRPFYGIFGEPTYGSTHFSTSTLVAFIVYGLVTIGIGRLLTLNRPRADV